MAKTTEDYISMGFDKKTAEYFVSGRRKAVAVEPQGDFTLIITFDNNEKRSFDMKPIIEEGGVFTSISDYNNFERVYIDDTNSIAWDIDPNINSNVVWNNKIDVSSDTCYMDSKSI